MVHTLGQLTHDLGWLADVIDAADFTRDAVNGRTAVIVATQGHGDEDAMLEAIAGEPLFLGLVASRRRAESVLGYLADRGVPRDQLERVHAPVGLDLGHTSHKEIAVAVLAELVKLRSAGALVPHASAGPAAATATSATATDPVCGMTVVVPNLAFDHDGVTYHFCGAGCRTAFEHDPGAHLGKEARC
jgi:xanthine dehydrogenase accessory factor